MPPNSKMDKLPPPPPPDYSETPRLYMTPHLAKRKDGLCPSLFHDVSNAKPMKEKPGFVHKSYQTNSKLLLKVQDKQGVPREVVELQTIIEAIKRALKAVMNDEKTKQMASMRFNPEGCIWKMEFDPSHGDAHTSYRMEVICQANAGGSKGVTNYYVDSVLIPKRPVDPNPLASELDGYKAAKAVFERVAIIVRKAIVRLELPEFPEGCRNKQFKEVYQLNARVRVSFFPNACSFRVMGHRANDWLCGSPMFVAFFIMFSLSRAHLQLYVVERTVQRDEKWPSSVCSGKISHRQTTRLSTTKSPFCPVSTTLTLCLSLISLTRKTATLSSWNS